MVRVWKFAGLLPAVVVVMAATPALAQFVPSNTPIQSITVTRSGSSPVTVGQQAFFNATAILADEFSTTRMLGGGGGSAFWNVHWAPQIGVSVCGTGEVSYSSQNFQIDTSGVFHAIWSPSVPNTLKADGLMTMPTATTNASMSASLACGNNAATGSMSAVWNGTHYDGTYTFNGGDGLISVVGVSWSSSNPSVATVNDRGVAMAHAEGDTTITATFGSLCWQMIPGTASCVGSVSGSFELHVDPASTGGGGGGGGGSEPFMTAGPDQTVECSSPAGASVTLQGAIFFEPETPLTYAWSGPFAGVTGLTPTVTVPLGSNELTFTISDGVRSASDTTTITVVDTTPPAIASVTANPSEIWPPNNKMVSAAVAVSASDACSTNVACRIIEVIDSDGAAYEITGPLTLKVLAARSGSGGPRAYTVKVECSDPSGNKSVSTVTIAVPHDRR